MLQTLDRDFILHTDFETTLPKSDGFFENVFTSQQDAIFILDNNPIPNIADCNPAAERMFGYTKQELLGKPVSLLHADVVSKDINELRQLILSSVERNGFCHISELWRRRRDGTLFPCEYTVTPLRDSKGNSLGWTSVTHDISERVQMENELRLSSEKIKKFAYSICHDLKNPTIALRWFANRLAERYGQLLDEQGNMCCDRIRRASDEVIQLLTRLNEYISTKELALNVDEINLDELFQIIKEEFLNRALTLGVTLSVSRCSVKMRADRMCLMRALRNLVENALKHGGDQLNEISIGFIESDEFHVISVRDDGAGLDGEGNKLFDLFSRGKNSNGIPGSGLGLSIVNEVATSHLGSITIGPGPKTEFILSLSKSL